MPIEENEDENEWFEDGESRENDETYGDSGSLDFSGILNLQDSEDLEGSLGEYQNKFSYRGYDSHTNSAIDAYLEKKYETALSLLKDAEEGFMRHLLTGICHNHLENLDEAVKSFDKSLDYDPLNPKILFLKGNALMFSGKPQEAIEPYDRALKLKPEWVLCLNSRGCAYYNMGEPEKALENFKSAISLQKENPMIWENHARSLTMLKRYPEAAKSCKKTLELEPENESVWKLLGIVQANSGEINESIKSFSEAVKLNPKMSEAWNYLGHVKMQTTDLRGSLESFFKAAEINPDEQDNWNNIGKIQSVIGDYANALKSYEEILRINPLDDLALHNTGTLLRYLGNIDKALERYTAAIELKQYFNYHISRGYLYFVTGDIDGAIADYESAWKLNSKVTLARVVALIKQTIEKLEKSKYLVRECEIKQDYGQYSHELAKSQHHVSSLAGLNNLLARHNLKVEYRN